MDKLISDRVKKAIAKTMDRIYKVLRRNLGDYYADYTPKVYKRTMALMNSVVKVDVTGNLSSGFSAEVKIDEAYLEGRYSYVAEYDPPWSGQDWTGLDVAQSAESGLHGGLPVGSGSAMFMKNTLFELGGEAGIKSLLASNLRAFGLPVA